MSAQMMQHEAEVEFDIDVELPPEFEPAWVEDADAVELSSTVLELCEVVA